MLEALFSRMNVDTMYRGDEDSLDWAEAEIRIMNGQMRQLELKLKRILIPFANIFAEKKAFSKYFLEVLSIILPKTILMPGC